MTNILLINSSKKFEHSEGKLNDTLHEVAKNFLTDNGFFVQETIVDKGYNKEEEVEKILKSNIIIHQMPAWWMAYPWITKKYMDEVFTCGHGSLYKNDGRTRSDSSKKYGSGGLVNNIKYMFSITWNAPEEAFFDESQFFEGKGIDGVLFHMHKAHQFLGMNPIPTFMCNDVMKAPNVDDIINTYKNHLKENIIKHLNIS